MNLKVSKFKMNQLPDFYTFAMNCEKNNSHEFMGQLASVLNAYFREYNLPNRVFYNRRTGKLEETERNRKSERQIRNERRNRDRSLQPEYADVYACGLVRTEQSAVPDSPEINPRGNAGRMAREILGTTPRIG